MVFEYKISLGEHYIVKFYSLTFKKIRQRFSNIYFKDPSQGHLDALYHFAPTDTIHTEIFQTQYTL